MAGGCNGPAVDAPGASEMVDKERTRSARRNRVSAFDEGPLARPPPTGGQGYTVYHAMPVPA